MNIRQIFLLNHIEVGSLRIIVDLKRNQFNRGQVREILAAADHAMHDNDVPEILVIADYDANRDTFMAGYDFYRYGQKYYRLVNPNWESNNF